MKTRKKRLLSFLTCVAMFVAMVPMNVFAEDGPQLSAETDGVAKHYEYNVNASDITPDTTGNVPVYNYTVPAFNDVGDTITINFKDVAPANKTYSSYIKRSDVYCNNDAEFLEYIKNMIDDGHPDAAQFVTNLANGYKNAIVVSIPLYNQSDISDCSYTLKINNKLYKAENDSLVEITAPADYPTVECLSWDVSSHNSVLGTSLPEKMFEDPATLVDMSQAQLDKIDFQLYYKGNLVETYNLSNIYTSPIEYNKTFMYTITYKLNTDGTVTATAPASMLMAPEASIQYAADAEYIDWGNKTSDDTNVIYNFTDANVAKNIRVTSISGNANKLQTTLDVTNIDTLKSIYDNKDIVQPEIQTVTVTPTVSVIDMPAAGTKTEGFDITFKSNVPVVLTTQEAPDTSVCSITTKQSDDSYTGVYHVGEVGNADIKFNVKPTVASIMSDDGLTKTVYNSTSYTLKIKAFTSDYRPPVDITDTGDGVIPDDEVIKEVPEGDIPDDNRPNVPATGDSTNIALYLVIMLASLTIFAFCIRYKAKAKKLFMLILVCTMIGGSITGPSLVPTTAYAAGNTNATDSTPLDNYPSSAYDGKWTITPSTPINFVFTLMDDALLQDYMKNGWQNDKKLSQQIHYGFATMTCTMTPDDSVYKNVKSHYPAKPASIVDKLKWSNCDIFTYSAGYVFTEAFFDFKNIETMCNILGYDKTKVNPQNILSGTKWQTAPFSRIQTNGDGSQTLITDLLATCANITDINTKVSIAKQIFNNSPYAYLIDANYMKDKHIVVIPYLRTYFHNDTTAASFLVPIGIHHMTGQTTELLYDPWAPHKYDALTEVKNICDKVYITEYNGKPNTNGLNTNLQYFRKWRGLGLLFLTAPSEPIVKYTKLTNTAYSAYTHYSLDNKNTASKTTTLQSYTEGGVVSNYANPTGRVTFTHTYTKKETYNGSTLVKTEYIDGVVEDVKYTDGKIYTKADTPTYSQSTSGTFAAPSGTVVKSNSVFNSEGYAVWTGSPYYTPYLEYKWVASSTGGIGNKYSLEITPKSGVYYNSVQGQFLSVANYKSYNSTIPTLANQFSYLAKNANASNPNRFSDYAGSKFAANLASNTYKFIDYNKTDTTGVYSQATGKTQGIAVATYTPINVTSKIVQVDLKQSGNSFVVNKLTDGTSKTYSNQSSTTFTTPVGYTYYKAVAVDSANLKVGDAVTSTDLTACNKTTLTVGSSSIDKGYVIYCYKVPDELNFTVDVASYVNESYINNIDFVYNNYSNGWIYATSPRVSGSLNTIYNNWTSKVNSIMAGCETANVDTVTSLAHQRTFMFNVNRGAYQTLNLSPFISGMSGYANTNGLSGVSSQVSTNKSGVTTMNSGTTVSGSAPNKYNNYYGVTNKTVFTPTGSLIAQPNIWRGTTNTFSVSGFNLNKATINYKNTTYVGIYNAPSIGTQSVTNKGLVGAGKTYAEVSNTGVKLSFVPHYEMQIMGVSDTTSPYNYSSRITSKVSIMSNYQRSFNAAMLSGYRFDSLTPEGVTVSDYVDNSGNTLKGSDMTLTVKDTGLRLNTYAYVLDIYGDGDSNEKINGYNPASEWGINSYSTLLNKANAKFADYLSNAQNNLEYSVTLDNEGDEYNEFTISKSNVSINSSVTTDSNVYQLTVKNGAIVNNVAYQNMLSQIKSDFGLASTTEAEAMFNNSGIVAMIMNSMHTNKAANNTSTDKWYDEGTNTICIRRFAKEGMNFTSSLVVQDKVDYDCEAGNAEWSLTVKNNSVVILDGKIEDAEFKISDKTTQSN